MTDLERKTKPVGGERADYGIDAPSVIRNLVLVGLAGLIGRVGISLGLWSGLVRIPLGSTDVLDFQFEGIFLVTFLICGFMLCWMIYDSKVGKQRLRDQLVASLALSGHEHVLDVGCGRGLLLIGAARHLTNGVATGIDLWQSVDLSGNNPEATLLNARAEGVADRIRIETGDMRHMPFADSQFDAILSRAAIHNLYKEGERVEALGEIVRVLKPGGVALISDIRHLDAYSKFFIEHRCEVQRSGSRVMALILSILTFGSLNPGLLHVKKPA